MLTPEQVSEILGVPNTRLQDWRLIEGQGPPFVRLGHRTVRYPKSELEAWIAARERQDG